MNKIECVDIYDRNKNKTGIKKIIAIGYYIDTRYVVYSMLAYENI